VRLPKYRFGGRVLSDEEIKLLFSCLDERMRRACTLSLYTGLRIREVSTLEWHQIAGGSLTIPEDKSKSGRSRTITLHEKAIGALGTPGAGSVFGMTDQEIRLKIKRASKAAGLGRVTFHAMRHTWVTHYMDNSDDTGAILNDGGWASAQSLQPYQHMTPTRKKRILGVRYEI